MRVVALTCAKRIGSWIKPRSWASTRREVWYFAKASLRWALVSDPRIGTWPSFTAFSWDWGVDAGGKPKPGGIFMLPKKKQVQAAAEVDHLASIETVVWKRWAPLVAHVAATRYDDTSPRKTGTIAISVQGDMWCVTCNDVDTAKRVRALAPELDKALALASALVAAPDTPWEDAPWLAQESARKKK